MTPLTIEAIQALKVRRDEVLIVRVPQSWELPEIEGLSQMLVDVGLEGRCVLIGADGIEFAVVKKDAA